jgi:decaprenylphospho-beta-D-erythro-pentofuranosid-2-ulose 2-reductase
VNVVLLGATRGMGLALARLMAMRGDHLFLLGREAPQVERCAADLEARSGHPVKGTALCDLVAPAGFAAALDRGLAALGRIDVVVVSAGVLASQDDLERDPTLAGWLLTVDFTNTVLFCEQARARLMAGGGGTLCVFGSVAGDRGRTPVVLYGAAKAGLAAYLEGLDHRFRRRGLATVCVKPGFVKTGMTAGLPAPPFAGNPEAVARSVLRAIDRRTPVVYVPGVWRIVMFVMRHLPRWVMRRIGL